VRRFGTQTILLIERNDQRTVVASAELDRIAVAHLDGRDFGS
jgi:hypothetical protein